MKGAQSSGGRPFLQAAGLLLLGMLGAVLWLQQDALKRQYAAETRKLDSLVSNFTSSVGALQQWESGQHEAQVRQVQRMLEHWKTGQHHRDRPQQQQQQQQQQENANAAAVQAATASDKLGVGSRLVEFKGAKLLVLALKNDEWIGARILQHGVPWEGDLLNVLMDLAPVNSTVIDAGANIGAFSIFLAHKVGPGGRVFSFEPQRKMYQLLCANAMVNSLFNVYTQNSALSYEVGSLNMDAKMQGGSAGQQELATAETDPNIKINYGGMALGTGGEPVQARTLDSYNLRGVSVMKMDVQGAEQLLMYGAQETIKREKPVVAYENDSSKHGLTVPPAVAAFNFVNFLTDLGYILLIDPSINVPNVVMLPPGHPKIAQQQAEQAAAQAQKQGQAQPQGQARGQGQAAGPVAAQAPALQPEGGRPAMATLSRRLSWIRRIPK